MLFQLLDINYFYNGTKPIIRMFGRTEHNKAICVFYDKFMPYFYIMPNEKTDFLKKITEIREIRNIEEVDYFVPTGYKTNKTHFLKITISNPQNVPKIKQQVLDEKIAEEVYEADILFKYRFMIDKKIRGMQWITAEGRITHTSTVSVVCFHADKIKPIEKIDNCNLKFLSFDIECISNDTTKPPDAREDEIIMISLAFSPMFRDKGTLVLVSKPINGKDVIGFQNEKEMLENFLRIVNEHDPDIITGYNMNAFDVPYILERFRQNGLKQTLGRCKDKPAFSKTFGTMMQESIIPGRIAFDPYQALKRDPWVRFHRYDLNTVSKILLNEEKHDVKYGEMNNLWNGTIKDVHRFIEYARKDAQLALRLVLERGLMDKFFELSKISGLLLQDCFGGQTLRIENMLLHEFKEKNFIMPSKPEKLVLVRRTKEREKENLKGATVLEPDIRLYKNGCVLVLDFKSLYPSIMRTYNISPDCLLISNDMKHHTAPNGALFVDQSIRTGIFPQVLTALMKTRSMIKKQMKTAVGDKKRMLNAKQLAIKDISNSFYGYVGYIRARLYMMPVASAVTAFGRDNIIKTKEMIEKKFSGVRVIYGDTDSIFLETQINDMDESKRLGEEISKYITEKLPGVLELEFEKIYKSFLILSKKRYAGLKFEKTDSEWKASIETKGIETVRRDWCPLVSEIMERVLKTILEKGDLKKAIADVREVIDALKKNKIPLEKLTVVKGVTKNPNSYEGTLPHIELAKKLVLRNPMDPPKIGDRLGYVIIKGNQLISKRAEDPDYVKENRLAIDSDYYVQSQLFPPLERIFNAIGVEKGEIFGSGRQVNLDFIINGKPNEKKKQTKSQVLSGWEEFLCTKCNKTYRRMTLQGTCECGGDLLVGFHGYMGDTVITK